MYKRHPDEYDAACAEHGWINRRLDAMGGASPQTRAARANLPPFSNTAFIDYLVRFIVADDQVSLTDLCLVVLRSLCPTVDPCRRMP
jgi:hypothetical protein